MIKTTFRHQGNKKSFDAYVDALVARGYKVVDTWCSIAGYEYCVTVEHNGWLHAG